MSAKLLWLELTGRRRKRLRQNTVFWPKNTIFGKSYACRKISHFLIINWKLYEIIEALQEVYRAVGRCSEMPNLQNYPFSSECHRVFTLFQPVKAFLGCRKKMPQNLHCIAKKLALLYSYCYLGHNEEGRFIDKVRENGKQKISREKWKISASNTEKKTKNTGRSRNWLQFHLQ